MAAFAASAQSLAPAETASRLFLDVSTGLYGYDNYEYLENPEGTTTLWGTDFVFGYESETRVEALSFSAGARFEYGDYAEQPDLRSQWVDPFLILDYSREGVASLFDVGVSYRERQNDVDPEQDFEFSTDLIVDQGTRSDARAEVGIGFGIDTPTFFEAGLSYHRLRYFDTTDPDLTDQDNVGGEVELGLGFARNASLLLTASYYDRDDLESIVDDEKHSAFGIGLQSDLRPDLQFRGVLRHERDVTYSEDGSDVVEDIQQGPTIDLSLVKDVANGTVSAALFSELDSNGTRTTLELGRAMELPRGELDFTLGATVLSDGSVLPVGTVFWQRNYRTRQILLDYSSSVEDDDDGADFLRNSLSFTFQQELTSLDGLQMNLFVASADDVEGGTNKYQQAALDVSYYRDINRDLSFVMGYRYSYYDDPDQTDSVNANEIFARIDKSFSLRP